MRRLLVVLVVAVVVAGAAAGAPSWAQKGPIKVGLLVPQTGPLAANGKDMINGFELFFEEHKYRLAGREPVNIEERHEDLRAAIDLAVERAAEAIHRHLERTRSKRLSKGRRLVRRIKTASP